MTSRWLSKRAGSFEASGIRRVFDLAAKLTDPINLSIGAPDFDVPEAAKKVLINGRELFSETEFHVRVRIDTPAEVQFYRNGGILPTVMNMLEEYTRPVL